MTYKIGPGKLWLDGSDRVSVPITCQVQLGQRRVKLLIMPNDKVDDVWKKLESTLSFGVPNSLDEKFALRVLQSAATARADPVQLRALAASVKRTAKGAQKSRAALKKRILSQKEVAFKAQVQELLDRGTTRKQLMQLIKEAIVEGVMSK